MDKITIDSLKQDYDDKVAYVKRMIKADPKSKASWKAFLHGVYAVVDHIMQDYFDVKDFPKMKQIKSKSKKGNEYFSKVGEIEVFGRTYDVYLDDYGQCYSLEIEKGNYLGLGTYNSIVEPDIVYLVFRKIHDMNLDALDEIK